MKALRSLIWQPSDLDSNVALRGLITLRLAVLGAIVISLAIWELSYQSYPYWAITATTLLATAIWSIFVLSSPAWQTSGAAELREILVDIAWVFAFMLVAGRATNPFIYYYLVLTAFSAVLLPGRAPWYVCGLCIFLYSTLFLLDIQKHFSHFSSDYKIHLLGMWINYVSSAGVICFFVSKLMNALRAQQKKMMQSRENNLKNEQLIGLATVSALTIHNLATPLSTLTLLVEDLAENQDRTEDTKKDVEIMSEQIARCRDTMRELSFLAEKSDARTRFHVADLVNALKDHYALHQPKSPPRFIEAYSGDFFVDCSPLFEYALINLINNALESTNDEVLVRVSILNNQLRLEIENSSNEDMEILLQKWGQLNISDKESGLGIGSMLANSTIERQGGEVQLDVLANSNSMESQRAIVSVTFPLSGAITRSDVA